MLEVWGYACVLGMCSGFAVGVFWGSLKGAMSLCSAPERPALRRSCLT